MRDVYIIGSYTTVFKKHPGMSFGDLAREAVGAEGGGPPYDGWNEPAWQAAESADWTAQVARELRKRIDEKDLGSIYREIELPLAPLLYRIERAGNGLTGQ